MIFDKSIKIGKLPFSCIDCIKAKKFFDKEGYFTNDILEFTKPDFRKATTLSKLYDIDNSANEKPFQSEELGAPSYKYFLPKEWVKEEKKKYKPFTLDEWIELHEIGEMIHFRHKSINMVFHHMYVGYEMCINAGRIEGTERISIGNANYDLAYLFENYEINIRGEWVPFGIEDEE